MSKKFAEYSKLDLSNVNKEVLKKWQDGDIFHKSLEIREGHPSFVFYEGPPSANGMPGIHHVICLLYTSGIIFHLFFINITNHEILGICSG